MSIRIFTIRSGLDRDKTAEKVFGVLGFSSVEMRESDHVLPECEYFIGEANGTELRFSVDDPDNWGHDPEYPYELVLDLPKESPLSFEEASDLLVKTLLQAGFAIRCELECTDTEVTHEVYELDSLGALQKQRMTKRLNP